jgi:putative oxidoreductase
VGPGKSTAGAAAPAHVDVAAPARTPPHRSSIRISRLLKGAVMRSLFQHVSILLARVFLSLFFLWTGVWIICTWHANRETLLGHGIPLPSLLLALEVLFLIVGGLLLMVGLRGRLGAILLVIFLVPDTLVSHSDWLAELSFSDFFSDVAAQADQITHFLKNLGLLGGLLIVLGFGSGGFSLDLLLQAKKKAAK